MEENEINSVYDHYYFKLNKQLLIHAGLWPYESYSNKLVRRIVMYIVMSVVLIPLFNGVQTWCGVDMDVCIENIGGVLYTTTIILKYWITSFSEKKLMNIYQLVAKNWMETTDPTEHEILLSYAKLGRIRSIGYIVYMIVGGICYSQSPMLPVVLDFIQPLNESRQKVLFVRGEFIIDPYKHFYKLYIYFMAITVLTVLAVTSIDTAYTVIVYQILGIFTIIKHRLYLASVSFNHLKDMSYDMIIKAILLHKEALQFVETIKAAYNLFFLVAIGGTILFISLATAALFTSNNVLMLDYVRFGMMIVGVILHFFFLTWPGQKMIDHSLELFLSTYENEWYNISKKSKNLLKIIMLRCIKPCVFTAGGLYVMNFENFGIIMRTTMSYITVIASFR